MDNSLSFEGFTDTFFDLYARGEYMQALDLLSREGKKFSARAGLVSMWATCLMARVGDTGGAVGTLRDALASGYAYSPVALRSDEDLTSLQSLPEFEELVAASETRYQQLAEKAAPELTLHEPEGFPQPWPLLIALHGNESSAADSGYRWQTATEQGWLVALPQSSQVGFMNGSYVWNDYDKAKYELSGHFAQIRQQFQIDPSRIVLAGFSKGAQTAAKLALCGDLPADRFIALEGWMGEPDIEAWTKAAAAGGARGVRGVLMDGAENLPFLLAGEQIAKVMQANGVTLSRVLVATRRHTFPQDFSQVLTKALEFLYPISE